MEYLHVDLELTEFPYQILVRSYFPCIKIELALFDFYLNNLSTILYFSKLF